MNSVFSNVFYMITKTGQGRNAVLCKQNILLRNAFRYGINIGHDPCGEFFLNKSILIYILIDSSDGFSFLRHAPGKQAHSVFFSFFLVSAQVRSSNIKIITKSRFLSSPLQSGFWRTCANARVRFFTAIKFGLFHK